MFKNYLKISLRNILKNRLTSAINILGLAIGIAVCLIIWLFISHEWSYDQFHQKSDRIFRVYMHSQAGDQEMSYSSTSFLLGKTLKSSFPEVEAATIFTSFEDFVKVGENTLSERIHLAGSDFLRMFDFEITSGKPVDPLATRNMVLISQDKANKYFGEENPLEKSIDLKIGEAWYTFIVKGVIDDIPTHSSLKFDFLISDLHADLLYGERFLNSWFGTMPETYILTNGKVSDKDLEAKFPALMAQVLGDNYREGRYDLRVQNLTEIHLDTSVGSEEAISVNPRYSYVLGGIALMILILACINYMTLALGRSLSRAREVGIRKVVGAGKRQILQQFWSESIVVALIATVLGIALTDFFLPLLEPYTQAELNIPITFPMAGLILGLAVLIGWISGSYPAYILSRFVPVEIIKGKLSKGKDKNWVIKGMVTFQFMLTIALIASTLVMWEQMSFIRNKDLGFDREQVVSLAFADKLSANNGLAKLATGTKIEAEKVKTAFQQIPGVKETGYSIHNLGGQGWVQFGYLDENQNELFLNGNTIDEGFIPALNLRLVDGRNFSKENTSDLTAGAIVNETYIRQQNLENPIGKPLVKPFSDYKIVGVVEDFHYQSFHHEVEPAAMVMNPAGLVENAGYVAIMEMPNPKLFAKLAPGNIPQTLKQLESSWKETISDQPFMLTFLDQHLARYYESEMKMSQLLSIASFLMLTVAFLGLFGIVALSVSKRTREIGLRKVLGASVADIVALISREFALLLLVALFVAIPIAWFAMDYWLMDFAVRINIGPWSFVFAGLIVTTIAFLTLGSQSILAARSNPIDVLRDE